MQQKGVIMKNKRKILKCAICGNVAELIEDTGVALVCCGQDMEILKANTVEASKEKHIPVATFSEGKLAVQVGSVPHPMTEEHHIAWIMIVQGNSTQRVDLDKTGSPTATFNVEDTEDEVITIYAYCNLHGIWRTDVEQFSPNEIVCSADFSEGCI